ncbi:hypothetical protein ElyMa_002065100 [Elysia marginata]|uniref:Uncharacterized protein n=1 Tax=Elysia marginata TaxID=1093978 RepID=A0AAV4FAV6_9GAST|nr:hypothetical protein ElyMa_002065100 [Elysia marginata]
MSIPGAYISDLIRQRHIVKKEIKAAEQHSIARLCTEARWPYTAKLNQQEIACMRDTYCGRRFKPTALERRSAYDRIHMPEEGWDQRVKMGSRHFLRPLQFSAREEELFRKPVVCANSTYGHRADTFYDFQSKENRKICHTKNFPSKNGCNLPPLPHLK